MKAELLKKFSEEVSQKKLLKCGISMVLFYLLCTKWFYLLCTKWGLSPKQSRHKDMVYVHFILSKSRSNRFILAMFDLIGLYWVQYMHLVYTLGSYIWGLLCFIRNVTKQFVILKFFFEISFWVLSIFLFHN